MTSRPRRSAHTPAGQGSKWIWPSTRWAIYHRDDFACVYCGHVGNLSLDHVRAVEQGGTHTPDNLVTCCVSCNSSKQREGARGWYARLRLRGYDSDAARRRVRRAVAKDIDRARGRLLAQAQKGNR